MLTILPFTRAHLDGAGAVLAALHRRSRAREPDLPDRFEETAASRGVIGALLDEPGACAVAALRDGRLAGYLIGSVVSINPASADAVYLPPRSARVAYGGAAAESAETCRALYAALAPEWLAAGALWHDVLVPAVERAVLDAWASLGFGLESMRGLRRTAAPVVHSQPPGDVRFRLAGSGDLAGVARLTLDNARHHAGSAVFLPLVPEAPGLLRRYTDEALADADNAYWLAERGDAPVCLLGFHPVRGGGTLVSPHESIYLAEAYTEPSARGLGVASALLAHCLRWAATAGCHHCAVSWDSANIEGSRFWLGHGFRPVSARLYRLLDERITWAQPSPRA